MTAAALADLLLTNASGLSSISPGVSFVSQWLESVRAGGIRWTARQFSDIRYPLDRKISWLSLLGLLAADPRFGNRVASSLRSACSENLLDCFVGDARGELQNHWSLTLVLAPLGAFVFAELIALHAAYEYDLPKARSWLLCLPSLC